MRALVTGGAGFIGSNICRALIAEGHEVRVLDNLSGGTRRNLEGLNLQFTVGDIRDNRTVREAIVGCDVVFHLAASVGNKRSIDNPLQDTEINALGTMNILEAMRDFRVPKIVVSSSAGIYGELRSIPIHESHPIDPMTPYGASKLYTEKMALAFAQTFGFEAICLRYFNVYGPNQRFDAYGNVIPIFAFRALAGEPMHIFGDGRQTRDFVHVGDVVRANTMGAMSNGVSGAFNIASGTRISILDLAKAVNTFVERPVPLTFGAPRPGDVADSLADISAAHAGIGYSPTIDFAEGLESYMAWARNEAYMTGSLKN
jgi:UDP-glucose 4-epimerase